MNSCQSIISCLVVLLLSLASGCGPSRTVTPAFDAIKPQTFAVLPVKTEEAIRDQRIDYLRTAVEVELKNEGFSLLDSSLTDRQCSSTACDPGSISPKDLGVDSFLQLSIDSLSRNNFGLGYYNTIAGTLQIVGPGNQELARVEHQESERGGLIFQSGQIIQGIKESVENLGDDSYNKLAEKFARTIVAALPKPNREQNNAVTVTLDGTETKKLSPGVFEICAKGTPKALANLIINRSKTNLRETAPGNYCGIYHIDAGVRPEMVAVELRSPFGNPVRKTISLNVTAPCDLSEGVRLVKENNSNKLELSCISFPNKKESVITCESDAATCEANKVLVFRSSNAYGPYEKVAELTSGSWIDRARSLPKETVYQVIPIDRDGIPSKPVSLPSSAL